MRLCLRAVEIVQWRAVVLVAGLALVASVVAVDGFVEPCPRAPAGVGRRDPRN